MIAPKYNNELKCDVLDIVVDPLTNTVKMVFPKNHNCVYQRVLDVALRHYREAENVETFSGTKAYMFFQKEGNFWNLLPISNFENSLIKTP